MDKHTIDDEPPVSAADALAIIQREQARTEGDIGPFFVLWGAAWLVIGVAWFGSAQGGWTAATAGITTAVVVVLAMAASALHGVRMGKGVAGPSQRFGAMYGWSWFLTMIGTGVLVGGLTRLGGLDGGVIAPALYVFVVGALCTLGAAFWRSPLDYGMGAALQVVALLTVFTPQPWNALVMGVLGGGTLAAVGVYRSIRCRAAR